MKLFFLDDARHRTCNRPGISSLVAVGGIVVDATVARQLDTSISALCGQFGFPEREPFKWSPDGDHWMRENLKDKKRDYPGPRKAIIQAAAAAALRKHRCVEA